MFKRCEVTSQRTPETCVIHKMLKKPHPLKEKEGCGAVSQLAPKGGGGMWAQGLMARLDPKAQGKGLLLKGHQLMLRHEAA